MLALRCKLYDNTSKVCREIAYVVRGQLHSLPKQQKKFITLSSREVYGNAWYIIQGVSRSTYHKYMAAALAGRINECMGTLESLGYDHIQFRRKQIL